MTLEVGVALVDTAIDRVLEGKIALVGRTAVGSLEGSATLVETTTAGLMDGLICDGAGPTVTGPPRAVISVAMASSC